MQHRRKHIRLETPRYNFHSYSKFLRPPTILTLLQYASSFWTVMSCFVCPSSPGIHRALTLDITLHGAFAALDLWFEPTISFLDSISHLSSTFAGQTPRLHTPA